MKFISAAVALFLLASPVVLAKKGDKMGQTGAEDDKIDSCLPTIAVANRASGSVSILDAEFGNVLKTVDLPGNAEPVRCEDDVSRQDKLRLFLTHLPLFFAYRVWG